MADIWQWKGDGTTGSGLVHFTGTETVVISGNVTTNISGTVTVVVSGTATVNFSGSGTVAVTGTATVNFSGSGTISTTGSMTVDTSGNITVVTTGTSTVNFSGNGTVEVVTSAGATARFSGANPGSVQLTATSTVNFSGSGTVAVSGNVTVSQTGNFTVVTTGTSTVNFSGSGTVAVTGNVTVATSSGAETFIMSNPGYVTSVIANQQTVYSGTATWTSGTTATSSQTLTVGALTANTTTPTHEILVTNNGPYNLTADVYKVISAVDTTNVDIGVNFTVPALVTSAGVTIGGQGTQVRGLFNVDLGLVVRLTATAAFTAAVTNYVLIKELDV